MTNAIIIIIIAVALFFGVKHMIDHFHGKSGCCGGSGSSKPKKAPQKKLSGVKLGEKVVSISGMHCEHCAASVTKALNEIEGVSAKVSLQKKQAIVSYDREISDEKIREAIEKAGFQVEVRSM